MKCMKRIGLVVLGALTLGGLSACGSTAGKGDTYTADGKLEISIRNLYFESWTGADVYTDFLSDKFKVAISPSTYSYNDWSSQVSAGVNANNLTDVFQANVTQFNFGGSYKYWAEGKIIKALPDDLSSWPNLKKLVDNTTDLDSLKIGGHLYGLPIAKNIAKPQVDYSPFTYVYRRDWAKQWGVYQENDIYTWEQFQALVKAFDLNLNPTGNGSKYAMADVEWAFPSLTNFYKQVPHCFAYDESAKKYVCNFSTDAYVSGMDVAKNYVDKKYYGYDQYNNSTEGGARKAYTQNKCGILYENLSTSNFEAIRKGLNTTNGNDSAFALDDASAILKVKGPDGKFALEGTDNWFSMTLFNADMSDNKMKTILTILDYLLGEEGTKLAVYGEKGYDYTEDETGAIQLTENGWPKDDSGKYVAKTNGAKYLRYVATLGNDYSSYDPLTDLTAYKILSDWSDAMDKAASDSSLRVVKEKSEVMWLSTTLKDQYESGMLSGATANVIKYCYSNMDKAAYLASFATDTWTQVLNEINTKLGASK
jgi:hypothetical protein